MTHQIFVTHMRRHHCARFTRSARKLEVIRADISHDARYDDDPHDVSRLPRPHLRATKRRRKNDHDRAKKRIP